MSYGGMRRDPPSNPCPACPLGFSLHVHLPPWDSSPQKPRKLSCLPSRLGLDLVPAAAPDWAISGQTWNEAMPQGIRASRVARSQSPTSGLACGIAGGDLAVKLVSMCRGAEEAMIGLRAQSSELSSAPTWIVPVRVAEPLLAPHGTYGPLFWRPPEPCPE